MNKTSIKSLPSEMKSRVKKIYFVKVYQRLVFRHFKSLSHGQLELDYNGKLYRFGDSSGAKVSIAVHHPSFFKLAVFKGHLGFVEAFVQGCFTTPGLTELLTFFAKNIAVLDQAESGFSWFFSRVQQLYYRFFERNSLPGAKKNIYAHYDLGNELFATFLDQNMQYSSAIFAEDSFSLDEAQLEKMQAICTRLALSKDDHVLEIGSGWGGLAIYMAKHIGCNVTTVTISEQQYQYALERIQREGLAHLVSIKLCDYRELTGSYDKIVSVEMIEAVGDRYYQVYFDKCQHLLKVGGLFLMQAILIADHEYSKAKNSVDFIKRYIFPGSNIPSLGVLNLCANKASMRIDGYFDMTRDYVKTLALWQQNFNSNSEQLLKMGYDEFFQKIWNFYFSYCQAGFLVEHIRDAHLVFKRL